MDIDAGVRADLPRGTVRRSLDDETPRLAAEELKRGPSTMRNNVVGGLPGRPMR